MPLSGRSRILVERLFDTKDREACLAQLTFSSSERTQFAAIKYSLGDFKRLIDEVQSSPPAVAQDRGSLELLAEAVTLGRFDFRDLLCAVGFGNDTVVHERWFDEVAQTHGS